ncbi:MAG: hypothetical protein JWO25_3595 [Alphaproteobacteria bacterium]|nr:hypothetical protein [Alphaproteobacteria bacterium]
MPVLVVASAVALNLSPVTLKQAEGLSPAALADRLLTGPHRPIVEKNTTGEGGPPPPPGGSITSEIQLWDQAHGSREAGFCEKTRYAIFLAPVIPAADRSLPPAEPARMTQSTSYRWNPGHGAAACEGHYYDFFRLRDAGDAARVFAAIRLLASARKAARADEPLPFLANMDDVLGREAAMWGSSTKAANPDALVPMNDWKSALARYPLDKIVNYFLPKASSPPGNEPHTVVFDATGFGGWMQATIVIEGDRIAKLELKRFIPPPF